MPGTVLGTAAAKSLQSCPTLCDPIDGSPPGSPVPGILQARTLEWVAICFSTAWKWKWSRVWLFMTPWTAAHQAPPSLGFSRQEYWSGVLLSSPVLGTKSANYSKGLYWISAMCNNILKILWKSSLDIRKELLTQTCFTKTLLLGQSHFRYHPPSLGLWFSFAGRESDW